MREHAHTEAVLLCSKLIIRITLPYVNNRGAPRRNASLNKVKSIAFVSYSRIKGEIEERGLGEEKVERGAQVGLGREITNTKVV